MPTEIRIAIESPDTTGGGDSDYIENIPPRLAAIHNIMHVTKGNAGWEQPDPKAIEAIRAIDPRVEYFPAPNPLAVMEHAEPHFFDEHYYDLVIRPLIDEVQARFPGKTVGLRGIKTSINGDRSKVSDIARTLAQGNEKGTRQMNLALIMPNHRVSEHQVAIYTVDAGMFREETRDNPESIFPAVLVFDMEQLQPARLSSIFGIQIEDRPHYNPNTYEYKDPKNAQQAILAAFILDCPLAAYQHLQR